MGQVKLKAKFGDQDRNKTIQMAMDYSGSEVDQGVGTTHILKMAHTKTKKYNFNEKGEIIDVNKRLIVPQVKFKEIVENHNHMLAGHLLGIAKTIPRIKRQYYWKELKKDVVAQVTSCILCARRKAIGATKAPLQHFHQ